MKSYVKLKVENLKENEIERCAEYTSDVSYSRIEIKQVNDHTTYIVIISSYSKEFLEDTARTFIRACKSYCLFTDIKISIIEQHGWQGLSLSQEDNNHEIHIKCRLPSIKDILDNIKCLCYIILPIVAFVGIYVFANTPVYEDLKHYACSMMLSDSEKIAVEYDRLVAE
jgi:hypothetical protein